MAVTVKAKSVSGEEFLLQPVSLSFTGRWTTAADCLKGRFVWNANFSDFKRITLFDGNNHMIFLGNVEREAELWNADGHFLEVTADSYGAMLHRHFVLPGAISDLTARDFYFSLLYPIGMDMYAEDLSDTAGWMKVNRGDSIWTVAVDFAGKVYSEFPRVTGTGVLWMGNLPMGNREKVTLGENGDVPIISYGRERNPQSVYHKIAVVRDSDNTFLQWVEDASLTAEGVSHTRAVYSDASQAEIAAQAQNLLASAKKQYRLVRVICPGEPVTEIGEAVDLDDPAFGSHTDMVVVGLDYRYSVDGETTEYLLRDL